MKINTIKNLVAFKEVLNNNGYNVEMNNSTLKVKKGAQKFAYLNEKDTNTNIKVLETEISLEDAKQLVKELTIAMDMADYIESMCTKNNK